MHLIFPFILSTLLFLSGCASLSDTPQKMKNSKHLYIGDDAYIETSSLFPLPFQGVFLQHLTATFQEQSSSFSVHLTLLPKHFKAVAFNDIMGQLYELNWTQNTLTWSASTLLPKQLKPDYILSDFLLTYLPLKTLKKHLHGATATQEKEKRIIRMGGHIVREIERINPSGVFWKKIIIHNTKQNYQLTLKTMQLS